MSLPVNIEDIINGTTVEWERVEFKSGWNPNEIMHSITAFANDINNWGGGYVVIGIEEVNGKPILPPLGLDEQIVDKIQKELLNYCYVLKPNYFPIVEPVIFRDKRIIIIWSPGGQNRPYQCPKDLHSKFKDYEYYIRRFANTVKANEDEKRELYNLAGNIPFDDRINHVVEVPELKLTLIQEYLNDVNSELFEKASSIYFESLCKQMNIVDGADENLKPKNIGVLMFTNNPDKYISMSRIELVEFEDSEAGDIFTEKIFTGPIHEQLREVLKYIKNSIIKEKIIKLQDKAEAIRVYNYPYPALEESIVNAVYHKSYEVREPIEIRIYKDKVIILSFPGPDKSIRKSDLDSGVVIARRYRNRRIGEFLKELKLTEGRSTGIPKIIRSMMNNGSPKPIFDTDDERTYFKVELYINSYFISKNIKAQDEAQDEAQDKDTEIYNFSDIQIKILNILGNNIASKAEIAAGLGYKLITGNFKRAFNELLDKELIKYTIPEKPSSKNQRYLITEKAMDLLKNIKK